MAIILFDNEHRKNLFPATATQALASLRLGIFTIEEWWQQLLQEPIFVKTENYLQPLYKPISAQEEHIYIDASVLPNGGLLKKIMALKSNEALADAEGIIAYKTIKDSILNAALSSQINRTNITDFVQRITQPFHLFQYNEIILKEHFKLISTHKISQKISSSNTVINPENIFIEEGATVEHCILNASTGCIYIGKNATVMEGSIIRGSCAILDNAVVKCGTKIYGVTTIGKNCVVGGEIKNAIISDYSNKAHDGYLGDSFIGKWCNIGAGTSNSNVKNNASNVFIWNYATNQLENAGKKCGVVMGDYSRVAINSSINTGSSIGVCCNIFGTGLLPKFLHNFSWGVDATYDFEKALADIANWKNFKQEKLSEEEKNMLKYLFNQL